MKQSNKGIGLTGMGLRINFLDGTFQLDSELGTGTTSDIKIPF